MIIQREKFKLVPADEMVAVIRSSYVSDLKHKKTAVTELLALIDSKTITPLFGFRNEFGEPYIACRFPSGEVIWAGSESDWEFANSYHEDRYVEEMTPLVLATITKKETTI